MAIAVLLGLVWECNSCQKLLGHPRDASTVGDQRFRITKKIEGHDGLSLTQNYN
jgi:hypothetical protein